MTTRLPSEPLRCPVTYQTWSTFSPVHWAYEPAVIQATLPKGLQVQLANGTAWVSITPFLMKDVRGPLLPAVPGLSTFPETNVRTYGVSPTGVREWYRARWYRPLEAARTNLADRDLGAMAPIDPPVRFGFSEPPRRPSMVWVRPLLEVRELGAAT